MRDLLADNIALLSELSSLHGTVPLPLTTMQRTRLREVPSLVSWMYCFAAYVAIRTPDDFTCQMLAYARLIIHEALRHGGSGWSEYDRVFRRQLSINPALSWNTLEPSLQAATILGQHSSEGCCAQFSWSVITQPVCMLWHDFSNSCTQTHQLSCRRLPIALLSTWRLSNTFVYRGRPQGVFRHICATRHKAHKARHCLVTPPDSEYKAVTDLASQARK